MISTLFTNPQMIESRWIIWLLIPLCVAVAIAYKTVRTHNIRRLWLDIIRLIAQIVVGLTALGFVLWLIQGYWPQ